MDANKEFLAALKNASQALARISELDEVVTSEGELAVEYQKNVWAPRIKRILFLAMGIGAGVGAILGAVVSLFDSELSIGPWIGIGAVLGLLFGMQAFPIIQLISLAKMNSGKSKKPEHVHHVALVKAQRQTYSLIKEVWKPNIAILKRYSRKNRGNLGEYSQLCESLIRADTWVKTLTLKAQTAKLAKQNAAGAMKMALGLAVVAVAVTGVVASAVGSASQGVGGTRYKVTYEDGTTGYETR